MMRFLSIAGMAAIAMSVASCNSMSKEECRVADWNVVGDTDGAAGHNPQQRFADHVKSCSKSGITPDQTRWYAGYQVGIRRYCTPLGGAAAGEAGNAYHSACPAELEAEFMRGYSLGKRAHDLRSRVSSLESTMRYKDSEIDTLYDGMKDAKDGERRSIRGRIDDLERDRHRMRRELDDARYDLTNAERDLDFFRQNPTAQLSPPRD